MNPLRRLERLVGRWPRPERPAAWRAAGLAGLSPVLVLALILLNRQTAFAQGAARLWTGTATAQVVFRDPATDDLPGTMDPGYQEDVGTCTARLENDASLSVSIHNAYPGYTCTFRATVYNSGGMPVRLESITIHTPEALTVTARQGRTGRVLAPGQGVAQAFSVRVEQAAQPRTSYRFRISELFQAAGDPVGGRP